MSRVENFTNAIRAAEELLALRKQQVVLTEKLIIALKRERSKEEGK